MTDRPLCPVCTTRQSIEFHRHGKLAAVPVKTGQADPGNFVLATTEETGTDLARDTRACSFPEEVASVIDILDLEIDPERLAGTAAGEYCTTTHQPDCLLKCHGFLAVVDSFVQRLAAGGRLQRCLNEPGLTAGYGNPHSPWRAVADRRKCRNRSRLPPANQAGSSEGGAFPLKSASIASLRKSNADRPC